MKRYSFSNKLFGILVLILLVFICFSSYGFIITSKLMAIVFFDVGQGDASLIQGGMMQIVVDGGPDSSVMADLSEAMPIYDRTIELVIISHPHADHITGVIDILRRYRVKQILMPPVDNEQTTDSPEYNEFMAVVKENNIPVKIARTGQTLRLGSYGSGEIIWPESGFHGTDLNDYSIYLKMFIGGVCVLYTGDGGVSVQERLMNEIEECQILKVPHHGSVSGLGEEFLKQLNPQYAIISVGENSYGQPNADAIGLLSKYAHQIYRTDEKGTIEFIVHHGNTGIVTAR